MPLHVLIVEDNPLFRDLISQSIAKVEPGCQLELCSTVAQAIDALDDASRPFDLILVDLGLPDRNGIEVIKAARCRFPEVPVMVISVISAESSVLAAIRAGARGYILKGDSEDLIAQAIQDVLQGNYPISPALARSLFRLAGSPGSADSQDFKLSPRETETLQHISRGHTYEEVATLMGVTLSTVQSNIRNLYRKLNARSQMQAVTKARAAGLL